MTQPPRQIYVDLGGLRETSQAVRLDTEQGLRPGLADADSKIHQGVPFGSASPSGEANAARDALVRTLLRHAENGESHLRRADQIVTFLDRMLTEYGEVDQLSAMDLDAVLQRLDDALPRPAGPAPTRGDLP